MVERDSLDQSVEELLDEMAKLPMADVLVEIFRQETDANQRKLDSRYGRRTNSTVHGVLKGKNEETIAIEMIIRRDDPVCILEFVNKYNNLDEIANVVSGPKDTGVWMREKPQQTVDGISISIYKPPVLPSRAGRWFFGVLRDLALKASELHDPYRDPIKYRRD